MFAVIKTGGKQFRVEQGSVINVEKLAGAIGDTVALDDVLLVNDGTTVTVGKPSVGGASVQCEIIGDEKGPKLTSFKKIRRHGKQLKKGHRQQHTQLRVNGISCSS